MSLDDFAVRLRERMIAQANLLATLTNHPTLVGAGREQAVIEVLRQFVPRRFEVLSGAILGTARQVDVMVVETLDTPVLLRVGDVATVLPNAVRVLVEVKSGLVRPLTKGGREASGQTFFQALLQLGRTRLVAGGSSVLTALMSYAGPKKNSTLRGWISDVLKLRSKRQKRSTRLGPRTNLRRVVDEEISALSNQMLPDLVVLDTGPVARKVLSAPNEYEFLLPHGEHAPAPAVFALIEQLVRTLSLSVADEGSDVAVRDAYSRLSSVLGALLKKDDSCDPIKLE